MSTEETMFKIGDFSKLCRVPVSAIRYYADIGLMEPHYVEPGSGYRFYSLDQLPHLNRILALKDLGLSLTQIKDILHEDLTTAQIEGMLKLKEAELQQEVAEAQERLTRVRVRLAWMFYQDAGLPEADVVLKDVPAQSAITVRTVVPQPDDVASLFILGGAGTHGAGIAISAPPFTIFHDGEFKDADLDVEAVFPAEAKSDVSISLKDGWTLKPRMLEPIQQVATGLHLGDYDRLPESYELLGRWIEANHYTINGNVREVYIRPPLEDVAITEIQIPVQRS